MEQLIKKYPMPVSGLMLGLAAAGNLCAVKVYQVPSSGEKCRFRNRKRSCLKELKRELLRNRKRFLSSSLPFWD